MNGINLKTNSPQQTKLIAKLLAREILRKKLKAKLALVLALSGNLGGGKTTFARGFLRGAGIRKKITSPTFVVIKNYKLQNTNHKNIYHIDCYRLKTAKEILNLGLKGVLANQENIILIEWPEKVKKYLPKNYILIKFKHGKKENERIVIIKMNPHTKRVVGKIN